MFSINGEKITFAVNNEQDKHFSIAASTEDEKHWELHSIDENNAKLFTNGDYPLAALKTIVQKILIQQINDPDVTVSISQVKEDLLVIITLKEKWVERKITLQFDSKKQGSEIERLETLLTKTRRELVEMKTNHEQQIMRIMKEMNDLKEMINQPRCLTVRHDSELKLQKDHKVCSVVLPKGTWLVNYTFNYHSGGEIPVVLMHDSKCLPGQTGTGTIHLTDGYASYANWRYNGAGVVHSTGEGQIYLKFSTAGSLYIASVSDIVLYALPTTTL